MKIMVTFFKRSHKCTAVLSAHDPAAGHNWSTPSPETPGHSQASLGVSCGVTGHFFQVLMHTGFFVCLFVFCALQETVSQSCVSSGGSMVGLMVTSSKRAYAISRSAVPRAPDPVAVHCWPIPPQETLRHGSVLVPVGVSGSWGAQGMFEPTESLWWVWGLILKVILPLLPSCCDFSFDLGHGVSPHRRSSTTEPHNTTSNAEEAEVEQFYEDLTRPSRTNTQKRCPFHYRGLECKSRKSGDTWSNRQIWPWRTKWSGAKANRVLPRECIGHSIADTLFQQHKRRLYTWTSPDGFNTEIRLIIFFATKDGEALYSQQKQDQELTVAFFHFFSMGMVLILVSCTISQTSVHSSSSILSIRSSPLIYFSLPLYNCEGFDLGHTWVV